MHNFDTLDAWNRLVHNYGLANNDSDQGLFNTVEKAFENLKNCVPN